MAFFEVRVFSQTPIDIKEKIYSNVTRQIKWRRNESITNVFCKSKMVVSPPLVFSTSSRVGKEANKCYSQIAEKLAEKRDEPSSVTMSWI